ncbi:MAG: hypothetical protein WB989_00190, partial [Mycobacterium sp.]
MVKCASPALQSACDREPGDATADYNSFSAARRIRRSLSSGPNPAMARSVAAPAEQARQGLPTGPWAATVPV